VTTSQKATKQIADCVPRLAFVPTFWTHANSDIRKLEKGGNTEIIYDKSSNGAEHIDPSGRFRRLIWENIEAVSGNRNCCSKLELENIFRRTHRPKYIDCPSKSCSDPRKEVLQRKPQEYESANHERVGNPDHP
jgi:hypothetical protein